MASTCILGGLFSQLLVWQSHTVFVGSTEQLQKDDFTEIEVAVTFNAMVHDAVTQCSSSG